MTSFIHNMLANSRQLIGPLAAILALSTLGVAATAAAAAGDPPPAGETGPGTLRPPSSGPSRPDATPKIPVRPIASLQQAC